MRFTVFTPPGEWLHPVVWFLAGLTCTEENFTAKAGFNVPRPPSA